MTQTTASIHRHRTHTEQLAHSAGCHSNRKTMKLLKSLPVQMTPTHTLPLNFPLLSYPTRTPLCPPAPHLPSPLPPSLLPVSQHCALNNSVSVCVKGRLVHGVAWDGPNTSATGPPHPSAKLFPAARVCAHTHIYKTGRR